jgi:hypothetical integral membrane protein (TIGR02206 family)
MLWWGNDKSGIEFVLFSSEHMAALLMGIVVLILTFLFREKLRIHPAKNLVLYGLAGLLLCCEILLQIWYITSDSWGIHFSLPLQLCSMAILLSAIMLLTRSYKLFEFNYFAGIGGCIMALFTPELSYGFPHIVFLLFFVSHFGIIAASLFMTFALKYRPTLKSIWRAMLWLNVLLIPIYVVNVSFGANYMFLIRKPVTASPLDMMGPWPWYILGMEAMALVTFFILYIPFIIFRRN